MEFLGSIGIDIKLLLAQIINFGLLLLLLDKFLYKPIIKRIEKDELDLRYVQIQKKQLEQEKNILAEQKRQEIIKAKKRAQKIIKEAENIAEEIKKRTRQETEKEKRAVIKQIKSRLSEIEHAKQSQE